MQLKTPFLSKLLLLFVLTVAGGFQPEQSLFEENYIHKHQPSCFHSLNYRFFI